MRNFTYIAPTKLIFGPGELDKTGREAKRLGSKPLIVTGRTSSRESGVLDRVKRYLESEGLSPVVFDRVEPNPRSATVDEAADLVKSEGCDLIIGLGGGSPMDAAKGISAAVANDGPVWDFVSHGQEKARPVEKALPLMMIPTLAATGSEANPGAVITNWETHEKAVLINPLLYPRVSIIDPALTVTVSRDYTLDGGIDIISHVIEGFFTGVEEAPLQDQMSLAVIKTVMNYLPVAADHPENVNARTQLSWASVVALCGFVGVGRGDQFPLHAIEHSLSAHYDISHGRGLALLLPRLMEITMPSRPEKYAFMAQELFDAAEGTLQEQGRAAIDGMIQFLRATDRYLTMTDVGIPDESRFGQMADDTIRIYGTGDGFLANPKPLYRDDIVELFRMCLR
jgi:alcohol dehydrogenase YqhD (iron-dependent ADH family)